MTLNPLELASLEDLVNEIKRRGEACIVVVEQRRDNSDYRTFYFRGGLATCVGLARMAENRFLAAFDAAEDGDGDEL